MSYEVTLKPDVTELVEGADAYVQEGPADHLLPGPRRPRRARLLGAAPGQLPHRRHHQCPLGAAGRRAQLPARSPAMGSLTAAPPGGQAA